MIWRDAKGRRTVHGLAANFPKRLEAGHKLRRESAVHWTNDPCFSAKRKYLVERKGYVHTSNNREIQLKYERYPDKIFKNSKEK